jgi:ATP-dependent Clp protease ATP-binding subunit ClpC
MFERYTEEARRVIFMARYEASQAGSPEITTEHLLLGWMRECARLNTQNFLSPAAMDSIRSQIEPQSPLREKISTSVDLPLNSESKRALAYAAEESLGLNHQHIGIEHLLMGLLREEKSLAAELLRQHGLTIAILRERLQHPPIAATLSFSREQTSVIAETCRDLTATAMENAFPPLIGRERELETIIQVLGRRSGNNPVLVGEPGVGKTVIVQGLAQRIADAKVPEILLAKQILALDPHSFVDSPKNRREFRQTFAALIAEIADQSKLILFIDGLFTPATRTGGPFGDVMGRLFAALSFSQCIATGTAAGFREAVQRDPAVERYFRAVQISPPDEKDSVLILLREKEPYEKFHAVVYEDAAIETAVLASVQFMPHRHLPEKAIDLLDEAGSRVKLRHEMEPTEIVACRQRVRSIVRQMEAALASQDLVKSRLCAEDERRERETLRLLREKYKLDNASPKAVTREDIEELIADRTGLPLETVRQRLRKR